MSSDPIRMCELLVGLPDVAVLAVSDHSPATPLVVEIETRLEQPATCLGCGCVAHIKDRPRVPLVDLPAFGRPARLVWLKRRWQCPEMDCPSGSWTELEPRIAAARVTMTARAARWATEQVGRYGRTVAEVAVELGCDWHTINSAVIAYGALLVDHPSRIGAVEALGLDEVLFSRRGEFRAKQWSTSIVDVKKGQLLDVVEGRDAAPACAWLDDRGEQWCEQVRYGTLDLSGPYKAVFDTMLPEATQVVDPFHLVKVRREAPCVRGRVRDPTRWPVAAGR